MEGSYRGFGGFRVSDQGKGSDLCLSANPVVACCTEAFRHGRSLSDCVLSSQYESSVSTPLRLTGFLRGADRVDSGSGAGAGGAIGGAGNDSVPPKLSVLSWGSFGGLGNPAMCAILMYNLWTQTLDVGFTHTHGCRAYVHPWDTKSSRGGNEQEFGRMSYA